MTTQCANCSEPRFDSRERQEKTLSLPYSQGHATAYIVYAPVWGDWCTGALVSPRDDNWKLPKDFVMLDVYIVLACPACFSHYQLAQD